MAFDPDAYLAGTSETPAEKPTREQLISQIPGMQGERVPYQGTQAKPEGRMARIGRRAMESVSALPPTVAAPALALGAVSRVPQAVRGLAGPVERGVTSLAQALTPTTGRGLRQAATTAGIAGGTGEALKQASEAGGAGALGQTAAEFAGQMAPSAARAAAARGVASLAEKAGQRLYSIPEGIKTPELQRISDAAKELGITILPSQLRDSRGLKATERILQLLPGSASQFREFGRKNQESINKAITKEFGSAEPTVVSAVVDNAFKNAGAEYNRILSNKTFNVSQKTKKDLNDLFMMSEELRKFNAAKPGLSKFTQALAARNTIDADTWKQARGAVSEFVSTATGADRILGKKALELFDDVSKNNLSKQDFETLKGVDKLYASLQTYKDIYTATGGAVERAGDIDLKRFAQGYIQQQPEQVMRQQQTGRGAGYVPLSTVGKTFDVFTRPRVPETQATTLPGLARTTTGMSLLGGGLYSGLDAATLAGAGLLASRPLAGQVGQFYLNPQEYAKALQQIGVSPYAAILPTITRE